MNEWHSDGFWESIQQPALKKSILECLIPSLHVQTLNAEDLWAQRKKYFFKPLESFGSKAAYAGRGVTKKVFEYILSNPYLAQELVPAPIFKSDEGEEFKYDIRVYVYRDEIQLIGARLYQGQTTNFKTPRGGFAPVYIK
jgi:hypothetical protein